jgi:hypothetical protein
VKFTADLFNNLRRMCAVRGDSSGRVWKLRAFMHKEGDRARYYLCRNTITGEFRVVNTDDMSYLY